MKVFGVVVGHVPAAVIAVIGIGVMLRIECIIQSVPMLLAFLWIFIITTMKGIMRTVIFMPCANVMIIMFKWTKQEY